MVDSVLSKMSETLGLSTKPKSSSSYLINDATRVVHEGLDGLLRTNPSLVKLVGNNDIKVVVQRSKNPKHVALISGGGEGHYPAHAGFVGAGMLTASVSGGVFSSPPSTAFFSAVLAAVDGGKQEAIMIIKNYTGDRLNAGLAAELAKNRGIDCRTVLVGEDCSQTRSQTITGRRGLAGVTLVEKIVGAANNNSNLGIDQLEQLGNAVSANIITMGVATRTCDLPGQPPKTPIPAGTMELGIGIHGESGIKQVPIDTMHNTVKIIIDTIMSPDPERDYGHKALQRAGSKPRVVLMINNTQGLTAGELSIAANEAYIYCTQTLHFEVARTLAGCFLSSLDMSGFSISIMFLPSDVKEGDQWLQWLDVDTEAYGWPRTPSSGLWTKYGKQSQEIPCPDMKIQHSSDSSSGNNVDQALVDKVFTAVAQKLEASQDELNQLDTYAGDGDTGNTFAACGRRLNEEVQAHNFNYNDPSSVFIHLQDTIAQSMGGSSGAVFALLFTGSARSIKESGNKADTASLASALQTGVQAVTTHSGAQVGGRSMLDAIVPAVQALKQSGNLKQALTAAADAADKGVDATKSMKAKIGRASYLTESSYSGHADAGARAVAIALRAAAEAL